MKRVLITGKNSYVGNSFENWVIEHYPEEFQIDKISLRTDEWKSVDFSIYDVVLHAVGVAHIKETKKNKEIYYSVNRDLTYNVAQKAKNARVKQFIFLSSMSVYGVNNGLIFEDSLVDPNTNYGKSKLEAEELIFGLESNDFKISILRPPMIYGKGCKGNYSKLANLARKSPIFPDIINKRSMIYIENLSEFIQIIITESKNGLFFPQNKEYVCTSELVKKIADVNGTRMKLTSKFDILIKLLRTNKIRKVFGNLIYEKSLSIIDKEYNVYSFEESIKRTESK